MKNKVGLISLGCPKNLVDSEIMLGLLNKSGFEITNDRNEAEILIVNTCGFIESAKKESIDTILEMAECKEDKCRLLIVTGCLAERYRVELAKAIPEVDVLIGTGGYAEIVKAINKAFSSSKTEIFPNLNSLAYLENERMLSSNKGYAYLKISEGCDNNCTYCVIPSLRGRYRSRRMQDIVREARELAELGKNEIILISQDTTRYGMDLYQSRSLVKLVKKLTSVDGIKWIRLLYCYPDEIDDELIQELKTNEKLCKYIDIPVQHISEKILKAMGRRGSARQIKDLISKLRQNVPGLVIRTSLILGFPGETERDFRELADFVKEIRFDRLGVFAYSREDGTPAAKMKGHITRRVKERRLKDIMIIQDSINKKKNNARLGKMDKMIVDGIANRGFYYGRTYAEAPEIDWIVFFKSRSRLKIGDIVEAEIACIE